MGGGGGVYVHCFLAKLSGGLNLFIMDKLN